MYLAGTFKTYAQHFIHNENFLVYLSTTASLFNTFGRFFWGYLADSIGALKTLKIMSFFFALILLSYSQAISPSSTLVQLIFQGYNEISFAIWTYAIFFCEGANFVLYVPITVQEFGQIHSASNYGLIFSSYSLFVVCNITLLAKLDVPFNVGCVLMGIITFIGFLNLWLLDWHIQRVHSRRLHMTEGMT